jgi:hypothetical protein
MAWWYLNHFVRDSMKIGTNNIFEIFQITRSIRFSKIIVSVLIKLTRFEMRCNAVHSNREIKFSINVRSNFLIIIWISFCLQSLCKSMLKIKFYHSKVFRSQWNPVFVQQYYLPLSYCNIQHSFVKREFWDLS